ncbi:transglycosylase domain-containing protein [Clostridium sardiniense]|uniref:Penicillin-binding protein 1A n=1 Tax=Clostridium sardiniense TaxID=29369 RepID=A0ABS7KWF0_CLOSR|nr:transglycosylase domain-containing protein [Clostridium sardiniense]MBY0755143.1 transglycosylase domain-containing protein [Clostridium sardiniense]MDQ0458993.1 penicillin-binding protein 1A [Clostridium sardiniense]
MADKKDTNKDKNIKKSQASKINDSKSKSNKNISKKSKNKKIFKWIGLSILFAFLAIAVIGVGYVVAVVKNTPPIDINKVVNVDQTLQAYDNKDEFIASLHGKEDYQKATSDEIPQNLKDAIVSIEDERFYEHNGIDIKRILGAVANDAIYVVTGKGGLQGASTLTQQLVKNTILTNKQTIERKVSEMYLSLELEKMLTKDEILTAYLNHFPVGGIAYGAQAGAQMYFDKDVKDLSLIQCAYLAGVTQAPTSYSAFTPRNEKDPSIYINRTKTVLSKMLEHNYITQDEYNKAVKDLDAGKLNFKKSKTDYRLPYEDFIYPAVDQVKKDLKEKYKYSDEQVENLIQTGGLKVYTTMDRNLQDYAQKVLNNYNNYGINGSDKLGKDGVPLLQASATITDYRTGEVITMVGGRGDQGARSLNRAYDALRSVGSSTKPLTVYGPAIDTKKATAATVVDDSPIPKSMLSSSPNNSPNTYQGLIPLRESLRVSSNVGATLTQQFMVGNATSLAYGEKFGLKYHNKDYSYSAYALGQFDNSPSNPDGGNTYIMSSAIGTFGNNGVYVKPRLYTKVVDENGKVLLDSTKHEEKILSPQAAYIVYDMMKGPLTYNAQRANLGAMPAAGKTGTSSDVRDYWFAGLTPHFSGAVWVGYDNQASIKGGGSGRTASNLWGLIMKKANEGLSTKDIEKPSGIVEVAVCKDSGLLATDLCRNDPRGNRVYTEMFIDGTQPTSYCETHVSARVNSLTGLLATDNTPLGLITNRIFIKKDHPNSVTADYKYVLPTSYDSMTSMPQSEDKDKDKDKDKDNKHDEDKPNIENTSPSDTNNNNENNTDTDNKPTVTPQAPPSQGTTSGGSNSGGNPQRNKQN